jgi:chromosome segregation ATPase
MKKDVQEAIQFVMNDITMISEYLSELNKKVEDLDEALSFQNGSINTLEMTVKKLSNDFHEEQKLEPYVVNTNRLDWLNKTVEEIDKRDLEKALEELTPKNVTDGLNKLYNNDRKVQTWIDDINERAEEALLEKKIRKRIIAELEQQAEDNKCTCGDICDSYNNGFQDAIYAIREM